MTVLDIWFEGIAFEQARTIEEFINNLLARKAPLQYRVMKVLPYPFMAKVFGFRIEEQAASAGRFNQRSIAVFMGGRKLGELTLKLNVI